MKKYREYFAYISSKLIEVESTQATKIEQAIKMLATAIKQHNSIFAFGASHAGILSEELFYRAGGLVVINPILEPSVMLNIRPILHTSQMERLAGYGTLIAQKTPLKKDDVVICHSVSGRNAIMLDFCLEAKKTGAKIIAITNVKYSMAVASRHASGQRLCEIADLTIDNCGDLGDASISFDGLKQKVAPSSTVIGSTIVNSMVCGVVEELLAEGLEPPIFYSANLDGGDEKNKLILDKHKANIFFM